MSKKNKERIITKINTKIDKATADSKAKKAHQTKIEVWVAIGLIILGLLSMASITGMFGLYAYIDKCVAIAKEKERLAKIEKETAAMKSQYGKNLIFIYSDDLSAPKPMFRINLLTKEVWNEGIGICSLTNFKKLSNGFYFAFDWANRPYRICKFRSYSPTSDRTYLITDMCETLYIEGKWGDMNGQK